MNFCCMGFEGMLGSAGERGFGTFTAQYPEGEVVFVLQHRALDEGAEAPPFAPSPLSLVSDLLIQVCPWCGVELKEFYRNDLKKFDRTDLKIL